MKHAQNRTILLNFLHYTALYASRPYLSLLVEELGGSELEISLIVSVYSLVQVGTALWVGRYRISFYGGWSRTDSLMRTT